MKLGSKFSLITIVIVVVLSILLESISLTVFHNAIHNLNKELFIDKVDQLILLAYEQDELFFEGVYKDALESRLRVRDKIGIDYRNQKDLVTFPFIVETNGRVVVHPAYSQWSGKLEDKKEGKQIFDNATLAFMREKKEGEMEYTSGGMRRWCVFKIYKPWNWIFCMNTTTENKNKAITSFLWLALLISIIVIIVSVLVVLVVSRKYVHPIHLVIERLLDIASGKKKFDQRSNITIKTKDEIGMLAHAVNKMAEDLEKTTVSRDELAKEVQERKKAEGALLNSEQRFRIAAQSVSDLVYDWNIATGALDWFGDIDEALGYPPGEFPRTIDDREKIIHPDDYARAMSALKQHLEERKSYAEEYRVLRRDGTSLYWRDCGNAIWDKDGKAYRMFGACSDITERKKAEEERESLIKELKEGQELLNRQRLEAEDSRRAIMNVAEDHNQSKLALEKQKGLLEKINKELDDFTYIISHDLKEPLRSIDAFSKFIVTDFRDKLDEEGKFFLERIRMNTTLMQNLIEDLLEISRIEKKQNPYEEIEIRQLLEEVKFRLENRIKDKNVELIIHDNLPKIFCDRIRLTEVFANLVSNAIKFNDKPKPVIEICCSEKDGFYEFYVKDNGPGIEERYFEKIFVIFQRLVHREETEGTGAGLTIVKKIVQMHKGKIWLESKVGEGATFYFTIPIKAELIQGTEKEVQEVIDKG